MARPSKLNAESQEKILQAIRMGATYELASQYAGISYETFRVWMEKGETQNGKFHAFSVAIKEAEGVAVVGWLAKIEKAASDGSWQAAAWKLERRYPQEYGRTVQDKNVKHSGAIKMQWVEPDFNGDIGVGADELD